MNFIESIFPEHFTQLERKSVLLSLFVALVFLFTLIRVKPLIASRNQKVIATIKSIDNDVKHKLAGSISFYEAVGGETLLSSDEIFTSENSRAVVEFSKSKNSILIPGSSLVKIEEHGNEENVEVKAGVIELNLIKGSAINLISVGKKYQITAGHTNTVIKAFNINGELKLSSNAEGVKIKSSEKTKVMKKDSVVGVVKDESEQVTFNLLSPKPGDKIDPADGIKVDLSVASKYKLTLSKNSDFRMGLFTANFTGTKYNWEKVIADGEYYLRVDNGIKQKMIPLTFESNLKINGHKPADGDLVALAPGDKLKLSWNALPVKSYRVTVKDYSGLERFYNTIKNEVTINDVKGRQFEWMASPEVKKGKYSDTGKFQQVALSFKGELALLSPHEKKEFMASEKIIPFTWTGLKDESFDVKVFHLKKEGNKIVFEKKQTGPKFDYELLKNGAYRLDVSSIDYPTLKKIEHDFTVISPFAEWDKSMLSQVRSSELNDKFKVSFVPLIDELEAELLVEYTNAAGKKSEEKYTGKDMTLLTLKEYGDYCLKLTSKVSLEHYINPAPYCLKYIQVPVFPPLGKQADLIMTHTLHEGTDAYKITVPTIKKAEKYTFEIFKNKNDPAPVYKEDSKTPTIYWMSNRSGIYFLRYKVHDQFKRSSEYSPFSKLMFPISPLSEW